MKSFIKAQASKLKFAFGKSPKIESNFDYRYFVPEPYKAVVTICADFELAWAWQWSKEDNSLATATNKAKNTRENFSHILSSCEKYNIPITWATVGHLFLESCKIENGNCHQEIKTLNNFENEFWRFDKANWFYYDPHSNYKDAPYWYAPDLINQILLSHIDHEVGCHTFSHIDCRDEVCSSEVFISEIIACKKEARKLNIQLKSFVHPGHTIGNLDMLAAEEFTNFRTNRQNILGYPKKHETGLWEFEQTAEFVYRKEWSIDYHIYRFKKIIDRAIASNTVCYFWFHPSLDPIFAKKILPEIFEYLNSNRNDLLIINNGAYIDFLNIGHEK